MSTTPKTMPAAERALLETARRGDETAYGRLVEPYRRELHAHCYQMLGSVHDAEDAFQEALIRAWRGLPRFEGRSSLRSWLYRISTNTSLDVIARRPKRVLPIDYGPAVDPHGSPGEPLAESVWIEPYPDERLGSEEIATSPGAAFERRESLELAFIAALQHLPARQRAVLILRAVLGFSAQEVADTLDTTVASVNSALQRARKTLDEQRPQESQQATLRTLGDDEVRRMVEAYTDAIARGDVEAVLALLTEDATWSMPPMPGWYRGDALATFLADYPLRETWRHVPVRANGQQAVGCYMWDEERGRFAPGVLDVLEFRGSRIAAVTGFIAPWMSARFGDTGGAMTAEAFAAFGLPDELPA